MTGDKRSKQFFKSEEKLKKRCIAAGIEYKPPTDNEKDHITRSRRESLRLLLQDPDAIIRRNKKRGRDKKRDKGRVRVLTEEQRINKNTKRRIKHNKLSIEERKSLYEKQKNRRIRTKWAAILNMLSNYNNKQSSKETEVDTTASTNDNIQIHTHDNMQNKLCSEDSNDTNTNDNDDLSYCNDNGTICGDTIIFDDHHICNTDNLGNEEVTNNDNSNNNDINNSNNNNNNNNKDTIMTSYIYIHQMQPGPHNITKAEKTRGGQRGDMHRVIKQTSIMPDISFMYSTEDNSSLRRCPHGSALESEKEHSDRILSNHNIQLVDITKEKANGDVFEVDGVRVVYNDSKIIQQMENEKFQQQIIAHFLKHHEKTTLERKNKNRDGHSISNFTRLDAGVQDRYPKKSLGITESYNGEDIPIVKTKHFEKLPTETLAYLFEVIFPSGQKFLDESGGNDKYNDELRYNLFAYQFNKALGYGSAKTRFEYYDILVAEVGTPLGASLYRHIDGKNDNRDGYTGSVVYSFHCEHKGLYYKCSIIMTSRTVCGRAMERIRLTSNN